MRLGLTGKYAAWVTRSLTSHAYHALDKRVRSLTACQLFLMADVEEVTREDTPLLSESAKDAHDALYRRFTPAQKRTILLLVSWAGLVPCAYYTLGCASTRLSVAVHLKFLSLGRSFPQYRRSSQTCTPLRRRSGASGCVCFMTHVSTLLSVSPAML
jgi:hypothetical protein